MWLAIRIHTDNGRITPRCIADYFGNHPNCPGLLFFVEEDASRTHYQGIIWSTVGDGRWRQLLPAHFDVHGNKQYSCKPVRDLEKCRRYLSKGPVEKRGVMPVVILHRAIDWDVATYHQAYYDEQKDFKKKVKEEGGKPIIEAVLDRVKMFDVRGNEGRRQVAEVVVDVLTSRNAGVNMFHARGIFNAVMLRISDDFKQSFVDEIISKF